MHRYEACNYRTYLRSINDTPNLIVREQLVDGHDMNPSCAVDDIFGKYSTYHLAFLAGITAIKKEKSQL
jgi:hypothetical protein